MITLLPRTGLAEAPALPARVPVTVLTGFLGSGKTTLLNRLLREPDLKGTAVIINEFGAVGLDHDLVAHTDEQTVLLSNGCICCTIRGDLVGALERLAADPSAQAGHLRHVVLETTGLADPAPILHTLMGDPRVSRNWRLAGVATTVDAVNGAATLDRQPEAVKQVAVADRLFLTKTDLAAPDTCAPLLERLRQINPAAVVSTEADEALAALRGLLDASPLSPALAAIAGNRALAFHPVPSAGHDPNRHDDHIRSFSIVRDVPLPRERFFAWLDMIARMRGDDLLRVKGLVHLDDSPDRPLVIHGVQHIFHPPEWLPAWPSDDRRTRIVFITRDIDPDAIEETLRIFERRRPRSPSALPSQPPARRQP
ncbi:MAG: GTP-binding protein [Hydrogenophaga sp.]|nr:GTP-binding protein [Hydrogenophaga sp.]MDZ4359929.1 GTP-binding protein [Variovorax sp.]